MLTTIRYWTTSISDEQAAFLSETFASAVQTIVNAPHRLVGELDLFSDSHRRQVLAWNAVKPEALVVRSCIHDIFAQRAFEQPKTEAICSWDASFTYSELDQLSSHLANHLVFLGVGPEVMVPLLFEKSAWVTVSILAVLKAGGAFCLLDPSHPVKRLEDIIHAINARILLVSPQHCELGLCSDSVSSVTVGLMSAKSWASAPKCSSQSAFDNAAYVIFTSGTTGTPKGIVITHSAFSSGAMAHGKSLGISSSTRSLQFASYAFDASLLEMLTVLVHGGTVCIPSPDQDVTNIVEFVNTAKVNWAILTPSFAKIIDPGHIPGLQCLVLGGEGMTKSDIEKWAGRLHLINAYGPTECSIVATVNEHVTSTSEPNNIGKAIGARSWLVDPSNHHRLSPIGCISELVVEGPTLARGYLNEPNKTSAVFIENPKWASPNVLMNQRRFYKTGDLVRYNSDGSIRYVGRRDTQVKIRGQRIEISEIEKHLAAHHLVQQSVVLVPGSGPATKRLVATIVAENLLGEKVELGGIQALHGKDKDAAINDLQAYLGSRVPSYMTPNEWLVITKMPLTTSGKADRKALTRWVEKLHSDKYSIIAHRATTVATDGPATVTENKVHQAVCRVLNLPDELVCMGKSFMSLGGDSITAMQLISRCRIDGIRITIRDVLLGKTIRELSSTVSQPDQILSQEVYDTPFNLSPIQQMYFETAANPLGEPTAAYRFNQAFYLRLTRDTTLDEISHGIEAVVTRHSMLRARFNQDETTRLWSQEIPREVTNSYRFQSHVVGSQKDIAVAMATSQASLDIQNGPVFSVDVMDHAGKQLLFLVAHHLVVDLVSWRVLLQDFEQFLETGSVPSARVLPFSAWNKMQADYAKQLVPASVLPIHAPVPVSEVTYWGMNQKPNIHADILHQSFSASPKVTAALLDDRCHRAFRTTPMDLMIAALLHSFQRHFKDRLLPTLFSESHGRQPWDSDIDLSETVGWFTTLAPVQLPASENEEAVGVFDMLRSVKDARQRLPGHGLPYFASKYLNREGKKALSHRTPIEILFNYLGLYQQFERDGALLQQERLYPDEDATPELMEAIGDVGTSVERFALFEITASIEHGILQFNFNYNQHMSHQTTIKQWIQACQASLEEMTEKLPDMKYHLTLADFPLLPTTYEGLTLLQEDRLPEIGITIDDIEDIYPCSPMQQGLLISQNRGSGSYAIESLFEISSGVGSATIDVQRLAKAWQSVVDRYSVLRTIFIKSICQDSLFDQALLRVAKASISVIDAGNQDPLEVLKNVPAVSLADRRLQHCLTICTTPSGRVLCKFEISHVLIDGSSTDILFQNLASAYEGQLLKTTSMGYKNFVSYIHKQPQEEAMEYWTGYLEQVEPCFFPSLNHSDERQLGSVSADLDGFEIAEFCRDTGLTPSNVLQTAWGLVLRWYTGTSDVCFGYLTSGRDVPLEGIEDAVGLFINMLVCRISATPEMQLEELVKKTQASFIAGLDHQHCSLAQIHHSLGLAGQPLFNTVMSVQSVGPGLGDDSEIRFESLDGSDPTEVGSADHSIGVRCI